MRRWRWIALALLALCMGCKAQEIVCGDGVCESLGRAWHETPYNCPRDCPVDRDDWHALSIEDIEAVLHREVAQIESRIPDNEVEIQAGSDCGARINNAIDPDVSGWAGGTITIVPATDLPERGRLECEFTGTVYVPGNTIIRSRPGVVLIPDETFSPDKSMFTNRHRGGLLNKSNAQPAGTCWDPLDADQDPLLPDPNPDNERWFYDCNIILEDMIIRLGRERVATDATQIRDNGVEGVKRLANRVGVFVAVDNLIYRNLHIIGSGGAAFFDHGVHNRYLIENEIISSGRGGSTLHNYMGKTKVGKEGKVIPVKPARRRGNAYWLHNNYVGTGDDAVGNIFDGIPYNPSDVFHCWDSRLPRHYSDPSPAGALPLRTFSAVIGNIIDGTTQANGIKIGFIPGTEADILIAQNMIYNASFAAIQLRNEEDAKKCATPPIEDSSLNVKIIQNTMSEYGAAWNHGIWYWERKYCDHDGNSNTEPVVCWYEHNQTETCDVTRSKGRLDGFYSAIFVRSASAHTGSIYSQHNSFTAGAGYAVYNDLADMCMGQNNFHNFVHSDAGCPRREADPQGTIPEIESVNFHGGGTGFPSCGGFW